jgi:hypothetical protein
VIREVHSHLCSEPCVEKVINNSSDAMLVRLHSRTRQFLPLSLCDKRTEPHRCPNGNTSLSSRAFGEDFSRSLKCPRLRCRAVDTLLNHLLRRCSERPENTWLTRVNIDPTRFSTLTAITYDWNLHKRQLGTIGFQLCKTLPEFLAF